MSGGSAGIPGVEIQRVQAQNGSGSAITAGSGVVISATSLGTASPPGLSETHVPSFSFTLPGGAVTSGSLGVVLGLDIAAGDVGDVATAGQFVAARVTGTIAVFDLLTISTTGELKRAVSGNETIAIAYTVPSGGTCWARVTEPRLVP